MAASWKSARRRNSPPGSTESATSYGRARILARIERLAAGNPGDSASVGGGVVELRIDCGPGYPVYFARRGRDLLVLLVGGDKGTQRRDISLAQRLAKGA